ncbi:MAG: nucleotidyl transferase AbiEii/AbiGii toxin family protein [Pseudonocardia sp.]|nr:nucleotidyl transferase AbiEii/AbiGii toxin family protein [Pseudonocardia sp.]
MSNAVSDALRRVVAHLDGLGVPWALVGGFAISVRVEPRFTRDVDVAVAVADDGQAEGVVGRLTDVGYRVRTLVEQDAVERLATVRMTAPGGVVLDLLFASSGIEPEVAGHADRLDVLPGMAAPVARAGHLAALKLLARDDATRPQDAGDLVALRPVLTGRDREELIEAARLVVDRGYHRGRDLVRLAADYLAGA